MQNSLECIFANNKIGVDSDIFCGWTVCYSDLLFDSQSRRLWLRGRKFQTATVKVDYRLLLILNFWSPHFTKKLSWCVLTLVSVVADCSRRGTFIKNLRHIFQTVNISLSFSQKLKLIRILFIGRNVLRYEICLFLYIKDFKILKNQVNLNVGLT